MHLPKLNYIRGEASSLDVSSLAEYLEFVEDTSEFVELFTGNSLATAFPRLHTLVGATPCFVAWHPQPCT